jgi:ankyrin repeat protein/class 3 adenylate cyclase
MNGIQWIQHKTNTTTTTPMNMQNILRKNIKERRPFVKVLPDYLQSIQSKINKVHQSTETLVPVEDSTPMEELSVALDMLKTLDEKLIYLCKHGSDIVSSEILHNMLQSDEWDKSQISKITDKQNNNCNLLHLCAQRNKFRCMEMLELYNVPIEGLDVICATPLMHAVAQNNEEAAGFLLSKGANLNCKDLYNKFPLLVALKNKHYHLAEMLTMYSYDVHLKGTKGNTALHQMAMDGDFRAVQFLIEKCGASAMRRNNDEENVLFTSLAHTDIVEYLSQRYAKEGSLTKMVMHETSAGRNVIHECCHYGFFDSLLVMLSHINVHELSQKQILYLLNTTDKDGDTPLILATKNGRHNVIGLLCQCEEVKLNEADAEEHTALHYAVTYKDNMAMSLLTSVGASLKAECETDTSERQKRSILGNSLSLNIVLVVLMSLIAVLCIVVIAAISLSFFSSEVKSTAGKIRQQSFTEVMTFVNTTLLTHTLLSRTSFGLIGDRPDSIYNGNRILNTSLSVMKAALSNSRITDSFYCGLMTGERAGVQRITNSTFLLLLNSYQNPYVMRYQLTKSLTDLTIRTTITSNITEASVNGIWLKTVKNFTDNQEMGWSLSYGSSNKRLSLADRLSMSLVRAIRDDNSDLVGFCGAETSTDALRTYLIGDLTAGTQTAIIERSTGYLIATSDPSVRIFNVTETNTLTRFSDARESKSMYYMIKAARQQYGNYFAKVKGKLHYSDYRVAGERFALNIGELSDGLGVDWIIVQSTPWSTFFQSLYSSVYIMIAVTVALLVLSLCISSVAAFFFMRPIKTLVLQAEGIKQLQLEKVESELNNSFSPYSEVRSLQYAYLSMCRRLKQFRSFIPEHILAVLESDAPKHSGVTQPSKEAADPNGQHDLLSDRASVLSESETKMSNSTLMKGLVSNALNLSLTSGTVTVMAVRFEDLTKVLDVYSAPDIQDVTKDILTCLQNAVRSSQGQFVSITSKRAVVCWNTFIPQTDHKLKAAKTARIFVDSMKKFHDQWTRKQLPILSVSVGLCTGPCHFGNLSSDKMKFFTVVGNSLNWAEEMSDMNARWGSDILICENTLESAKDDYYTRPIDYIQNQEGRLHIYELGETRDQKEDWANELDKKQSDIHRWSPYNEAFELMNKEKPADAQPLFIKYLEQFENDVPAQKMLDSCRAMC